MADEILIIKVKRRGTGGSQVYRNEIPLSNPSLLLLVFQDLASGFNAPIRKTCIKFLEKKDKVFPL